jgi:uncharacterized protein YndB with AHSA1/START domain
MTETFTITRTFNAPRDLVWRAWTEPKLFEQWFGPKGITARTVVMDVREGGILHACLTPSGMQDMWAKFLYREVVKPERLVWEHFFSDEKGGLTRHPFQKDWPLKLLTTVTFEESGGQTKVTLTWSPLDANDVERKVFSEGLSGANQGWGGTFDQLEVFLLKSKAA